MTEGKQAQIRETIQSQAQQLVGLQQDIAEWLKLHTQMEDVWRQIEGLQEERQTLVDRRDDIEARLEELEPIANRKTEDSLDVLRERTMAALLQLDGLLPGVDAQTEQGSPPVQQSDQQLAQASQIEPTPSAARAPSEPEAEVLPPEDDEGVPSWIKDNLGDDDVARGGGILGRLGNGTGSFLSL